MPLALKPSPPPSFQPAHPLAVGAKWDLALLDNSLPTPLDDKDGSACVWSTDSLGTTTPGWGADPSGRVGLNFLAAGTFPGTDKELRIPNKGLLSADATAGITVHCVILPAAGGHHSCPVMAKNDNYGFLRLNNGRLTPYMGTVLFTEPFIDLAADNLWEVVVTFEPAGSDTLITAHAHNATTGVTLTPATYTLATPMATYLAVTPNDAIVNYRRNGDWCVKGLIEEAGVVAGTWDSAKIAAYFNDPWATVRAAAAGAFIPMIGSLFLRSC